MTYADGGRRAASPPPSWKLPLLRFLLSIALISGVSFFLFSTYSTRLSSPAATLPPSSIHPPPRRMRLSDFLSPREVEHDMTDEELFWLASLVPMGRRKRYPYPRVKKLAFLFLTRGPLPLAPLWERFFRGHERLYSIYVHANPGFNGSDPVGSPFHRRRIPSQPVRWGNLSVVDAERRLIANALLDFSNERFVLVSESCIPLFDFPTIYAYLTNSATAFVESYDLPGRTCRGRYDQGMSPAISLRQWRKGSQWFEMDRRLALAVVTDGKYYPAFRRNQAKCCADEHYLPTMVTAEFPRRNANRSLTWVDWSANGWHPQLFSRGQVSPELLRHVRSNTTCRYNGRNTTVCFLFARKFQANSLWRLMRYSKEVMGF